MITWNKNAVFTCYRIILHKNKKKKTKTKTDSIVQEY